MSDTNVVHSQSPKFFLARDKIREALDPNNTLLPDDEIFHILLICGGDLRRATHKCILSIQAKAMKDKNGDLMTWSRGCLRLHEAGLLVKLI